VTNRDPKVANIDSLYATESDLNKSILGFQLGDYHGPPTGGVSRTANIQRTYYIPFYVPQDRTIDRIACRTSTPFPSATTVRLGIYNNELGKPTTVLLDAGTVSCTVALTTYEITISQKLETGWYWLAFNSQNNTSDFIGMSSLLGLHESFAPYDDDFNLLPIWIEENISGAFNTASNISRSAAFPPIVLVRMYS